MRLPLSCRASDIDFSYPFWNKVIHFNWIFFVWIRESMTRRCSNRPHLFILFCVWLAALSQYERNISGVFFVADDNSISTYSPGFPRQVHELLPAESGQHIADHVREVRDILRRGACAAQGTRAAAQRQDHRHTHIAFEKVFWIIISIHFLLRRKNTSCSSSLTAPPKVFANVKYFQYVYKLLDTYNYYR